MYFPLILQCGSVIHLTALHPLFSEPQSLISFILGKNMCFIVIVIKFSLISLKQKKRKIHIHSFFMFSLCLIGRNVTDGFKVNKQTELVPVLATSIKVHVYSVLNINGFVLGFTY